MPSFLDRLFNRHTSDTSAALPSSETPTGTKSFIPSPFPVDKSASQDFTDTETLRSYLQGKTALDLKELQIELKKREQAEKLQSLLKQPIPSGMGPLGLLSLPGTEYNYKKSVGNPLDNSAVFAVINWIAKTFPEAPLRVYKRDEHGTYHPEIDHELELLLESPNPYYDGMTLWMATMKSWELDGNAYWLKVRNGAGELKELYYIPHDLIDPRWPNEPDANGNYTFIEYYLYSPGGQSGTQPNSSYKLKPEDVVHLRYGLDDKNNRKGMSKLRSLFREIYSDNEATNFGSSLLRNMGVPGLIISPAADDTIIDPDTAKTIKNSFKANFTGDNRGDPMVMSAGVRVNPVSLDPKQLDLKLLHRLPEERITAVYGVPAIVVGLGAGLERSTMANFKEARELAYESNIIPTQQLVARQLKKQLLPEFEKETKGYKVEFDLSQVRVLQDDENVRFQRWDIGVRGGWIKRSEARAAANLEVKPEDEIYLAGGNAGIDEYGQPVPGVKLPPSVALTNAQALRMADGIRRNAGAASSNALAAPADSVANGGGGPGQRRGPGGRFLDVNGDPTDNGPGSPSSGKPNATQKWFGPHYTVDANGQTIYQPLPHHSYTPTLRDFAAPAQPLSPSPSARFGGKSLGLVCNQLEPLITIQPENLEAAKKYADLATVAFESKLLADSIISYTDYLIAENTSQLVSILAVTDTPEEHTAQLKKWFATVAFYVKLAHLVSLYSAKGDWTFTDEELVTVQDSLRREYKNLLELSDNIASGVAPLDESLPTQTALCAKSAWGTYFTACSERRN